MSPELDLISRSAPWNALRAQADEMQRVHMRDLFADDPERFEHFSLEACGLLLDYSKNIVNSTTMEQLLDLVRYVELEVWIERMFAGEPINSTEDRPALHLALRNLSDRPIVVAGRDVMVDVRAELDKVTRTVEGVYSGELHGSTGQRFTDVVNIGIGGSDLGAVMAVEALANYWTGRIRPHFVSNIDGVQLGDVLERVDPATTLFIICSKTFTTLETLTNAQQARGWLVDSLSPDAVAEHFLAVSVNHEAMNEFGISPDARFTMWDWVGGRYSLWSPIGLVIALTIGPENFRALLGGGHAMDEHFRTAPLEANLPVLLGLIGIWNRNFLGMASHAVLPYDQRLHRLPAFLQQLEMESNGKRVTREGHEVDYATCPVIWGEPGSNAQHSFFQLLHQGMARVATDFIAPVNGSSPFEHQHTLALANCLAQTEALMAGQTEEEVRESVDSEDLVAHKLYPGNRPSNTILFPRLDPDALGKLVALYEHKVFVQSVVWGVNAFDQWGVELGKKLASSMTAAVEDPAKAKGLNPSTRGLLDYLRRWR